MQLKYIRQKMVRETGLKILRREGRRKEDKTSCENKRGMERKGGSFWSDALVRFINLRFARED